LEIDLPIAFATSHSKTWLFVIPEIINLVLVRTFSLVLHRSNIFCPTFENVISLMLDFQLKKKP